jgi:methylated-DNA-[protein]-cysteine S-methyltransferase
VFLLIYACYAKKDNVWFGAAIQDGQVVASCFSTGEPDLERLLERLPEDTAFHVTDNPNQNLIDVLQGLYEAFNGESIEVNNFKININRLSGYAQRVLNCTSLIPLGYVATYGDVAKVAGGSARSVGNMEALNPVPLLIPCHRIVKSDFQIGGYAHGKQTKWEILQRENKSYEVSKTIKVYENELVLFPVGSVQQG